MQIQAISLSDVFEIEKSKIPIVIILSVVQCTIIFEVDRPSHPQSVFSVIPAVFTRSGSFSLSLCWLARVPGPDVSFLIKSQKILFALRRASALVKADPRTNRL
jgi:hypothetical protein